MKKLLFSLALAILAVGLVACGDGNSKDASVEDIFNNALEASNKMESAEFTLDMEQEVEVPSVDMKMDIKMNMDGSMIVDPLAMHQKGKVSIAMPGMGLGDEPMEMDMELYLKDDEMYMYEGLMGTWTKAPSTELEALQGQTPDVSEQMEMYKEYVEDFSVEESDGNYVLKLSADGEGFKELTKTLMEETMSQDITSELGDISQFLDNMEIKTMDIEMVIDKDTYDVLSQSLDMSITIDVEGEVLNLAQKMSMEFSNLNGVDSIEVPQEAIDAAL